MLKNGYEKKGYLMEDFRLFHLRDTQQSKMDYHYHEFYKILFLVSGSGGYSIEGKRYRLHAGDIVCIGRHCVHRPEFEEEDQYERIILYISPDFLLRQSTADCSLTECFSNQYGHILRPNDSLRKYLFSQIVTLEKTLDDTRFGRTILSNSVMLKLLVDISRAKIEKDGDQPGPIVPKNKRIREIMTYLDKHLTEDISIDHLAEKFYLSRYHMMRTFKEETGTTIHHYLSDQRLLLARDMIGQGRSATETCFMCGFQNYASFSRAYGKLFGTTPTGRVISSIAVEELYE